jgi:hypothetical protein
LTQKRSPKRRAKRDSASFYQLVIDSKSKKEDDDKEKEGKREDLILIYIQNDTFTNK